MDLKSRLLTREGARAPDRAALGWLFCCLSFTGCHVLRFLPWFDSLSPSKHVPLLPEPLFQFSLSRGEFSERVAGCPWPRGKQTVQSLRMGSSQKTLSLWDGMASLAPQSVVPGPAAAGILVS